MPWLLLLCFSFLVRSKIMNKNKRVLTFARFDINGVVANGHVQSIVPQSQTYVVHERIAQSNEHFKSNDFDKWKCTNIAFRRRQAWLNFNLIHFLLLFSILFLRAAEWASVSHGNIDFAEQRSGSGPLIGFSYAENYWMKIAEYFILYETWVCERTMMILLLLLVFNSIYRVNGMQHTVQRMLINIYTMPWGASLRRVYPFSMRKRNPDDVLQAQLSTNELLLGQLNKYVW